MTNLRILLVPCLVFSQPVLAQEADNRLNLVCLGAGSANKVTSTYAYGQSSNGSTGWANVIGNRAELFDDQVNIWVEGERGRVRMPPSMLPALNDGSRGWFRIDDLKVTDTEISGGVKVNFINKPKLRIDRLTGNVRINGKVGNFSGRCTKYDPATAERAF